MLLTSIEILSALGALGLCYGLKGFAGYAWLWQLPVFFLGFWLALVLLAILFLVVWCWHVDTGKPVDRERRFDRLLTEQAAGGALRLLHTKLHVTGLEQIPKEGRFMLVCNHLHILDPVVLLHCFRGHQLAFISKRENNTMPLVNKLMHRIQCQLINRENDREALTTILKCIDLIKEDKASIAVFPEGYTSLDGVLHPFRNGVFKIAQRTKVPIVVCVLRGTSHVFRDVLHFRRPHVYLDLVQVVRPEEITGTTKDIGDRVHDLMARAIGDSVG